VAGTVLGSDGQISLRLVEDTPGEFALIARWLSDPRVLEWVYGRDNAFTVERAAEHFGPRARADDPVTAVFVLFEGEPIGYLQFYLADAEEYGLDDGIPSWGADIFLGEPVYWGTGAGTRAMRLLLRHLFEREGAERVVIDPRADNPRAIRSYEKAGFTRVKLLPGHELHEGEWRDNWRMELRQEAWADAAARERGQAGA